MRYLKSSKIPLQNHVLDPVPTFLLEDYVEILLPSITKLVNLSLAEGVFPQKFKKVVVKKASLPSEDLKKLSTGIRTMFYVKIGGGSSCTTGHATY